MPLENNQILGIFAGVWTSLIYVTFVPSKRVPPCRNCFTVRLFVNKIYFRVRTIITIKVALGSRTWLRNCYLLWHDNKYRWYIIRFPRAAILLGWYYKQFRWNVFWWRKSLDVQITIKRPINSIQVNTYVFLTFKPGTFSKNKTRLNSVVNFITTCIELSCNITLFCSCYVSFTTAATQLTCNKHSR